MQASPTKQGKCSSTTTFLCIRRSLWGETPTAFSTRRFRPRVGRLRGCCCWVFLNPNPYTTGTHDNVTFLNPNITSVKVSIDGVPNKIYSQGLEAQEFWEEAAQYFVGLPTRKAAMTPTTFWTADSFELFIDLLTIPKTFCTEAGCGW